MSNNKTNYNYCNIVGATDVGCKRKANEDWLVNFECTNGLVAVVCDGMGGHVGGAVASHTAVDAIQTFLQQHYFDDPRMAIVAACNRANEAILQRAAEEPTLTGMGSTCVMLIVRDGKVYVGSVGDSRIYLIRNHQIVHITKDQSFVQMLVDAGQITKEQAEHHPRKNEITNALGLRNMQPATVVEAPIDPIAGDVFILCSDGLSGMINDEQILALGGAQTEFSQQQRVSNLIKAARDNGGLDNITCTIVEFSLTPKEDVDEDGFFEKVKDVLRRKEVKRWLLIIGSVLAVGVKKVKDVLRRKEVKRWLLIVGLVLVVGAILAVVWFKFIKPKSDDLVVVIDDPKQEVNYSPEAYGEDCECAYATGLEFVAKSGSKIKIVGNKLQVTCPGQDRKSCDIQSGLTFSKITPENRFEKIKNNVFEYKGHEVLEDTIIRIEFYNKDKQKVCYSIKIVKEGAEQQPETNTAEVTQQTNAVSGEGSNSPGTESARLDGANNSDATSTDASVDTFTYKTTIEVYSDTTITLKSGKGTDNANVVYIGSKISFLNGSQSAKGKEKWYSCTCQNDVECEISVVKDSIPDGNGFAIVELNQDKGKYKFLKINFKKNKKLE